MQKDTCLCDLLPLSVGCQAAGWYLTAVHSALAVLTVFRLPDQMSQLDLVTAALSNQSELESPAAAALLGQQRTRTLAVFLTELEVLGLVLGALFSALVLLGVARQNWRLLAVSLSWSISVTLFEGATFVLLLLRPDYAHVRACSGPGCSVVICLIVLELAVQVYLNYVVFCFMRQLKHKSHLWNVLEATVVSKSKQHSSAVNYAFVEE